MPMELVIKWAGKEISVQLDDTDSVATLKHRLESQTKVQAKRQKILGLKTKDGKPANDEALASDLAPTCFKAGAKFMMMG